MLRKNSQTGNKFYGSQNVYKNERNLTRKQRNTKVIEEVRSYLDKTSLHGLRYVGDPSLSNFERIFWSLSFLASILFATYYITNIYQKWKMNPIIISFSPFDADLNSFPFPSITICNMNKVKKYQALRIIKEGTDDERKLLENSCYVNKSVFIFNDTHAPKWSAMKNYMLKIMGQTCSDVLKLCEWKNQKIICDDYFNNHLTDEGLCCSFNRLPPAFIYRNLQDISILNQTYPKNIYDWTPESGFSDNDVGNNNIPLRSYGPGVHLGLSLVLDVKTDDYYCTSTNSIGFKVFLSNPVESPKISQFSFLVAPGIESRISLEPFIAEAAPSLRLVPIESRQCYFSNERHLHYYRTYTKRNCLLECQANYSLAMCKCIPFYLPRNKAVKVCGKYEEICLAHVTEYMDRNVKGTNCNCLSSCFDMSYRYTSTFSTLSNLSRKIENTPSDYFLKNMAIMHFFFGQGKFRKQQKSQLYSFTDILSNIGGLLGLCMGFSFLSLVEVIYFLTLKVYCDMTQLKRKRRLENKSSIIIYPFVN